MISTWFKHVNDILKTGPIGLIFLLCFLSYLAILTTYRRLSKKYIFILVNFLFILISIVIGCISTLYKLNSFKEDKIEIYKYFDNKIKNIQNNLGKKITKNYILESELKKTKPKNWAKTSGFIFGKIISENNDTITDAKIIAEGGSEVYSNSIGEFIIDCKIGRNIIIEKHGYNKHSFIVTENLINQKQNIILRRVNR